MLDRTKINLTKSFKVWFFITTFVLSNKETMKTILLTTATILLFVLTAKSQQIRITTEQQNFWNGFVEYVSANGYAKSPELDRRDKNVSQDLWEKYNKVQGTNVDYVTFVKLVQTEIVSYRNQALDLIHQGKASFTGEDKDFMANLSVVDGWAGSKTTSWKFPYYYKTVETKYHTTLVQLKR